MTDRKLTDAEKEWFDKQPLDAIMAHDRMYFAQYPKRRYRLRAPLPGEAPPGEIPPGKKPIVFVQHTPLPGPPGSGFRIRRPGVINAHIDLDSYSQYGLERLWNKVVATGRADTLFD